MDFPGGSLSGTPLAQAHWLRDPETGAANASQAMRDVLGLRPGDDSWPFSLDFSLIHADDRGWYQTLVESVSMRSSKIFHSLPM